MPPNSGAPQAERVIVTFNQSVPFSSSEFLLDMQHLTQARFSYVTSVSGVAHVYAIQPLPGQALAQVLQRLGGIPVVKSVEVEQKMKIHQ